MEYRTSDMCLTRLISIFMLLLSTDYTIVKLACAENNTTDLVKLFYEGCSYNNFCNLGSTPVPTGFFSCCAKCSCLDDCFVGNKCCPDSKVANRHYGSCKPQSEYFDYHRNVLIADTGYGNSYYVIDTCKEGFDNETVDGCLHPSSLDEHVFVSDLEHFSIFKNIKCAACNGVKKYITWQQTILCRYDDAIVSFDDRNEYILSHCGLVSEPPENIADAFNPLICKPDAISECNITGEWDYFDFEVKQACKSIDVEYRDEHIFRNRVLGYNTYKNVYCFMCNKKKGTMAQSKCLTEIKGADTEKSLSGLPALTAVFDARPVQVTTMGKCKANEVEEHLLGSCKRLFCPFGKTAVFGNCKADIRLVLASLSTSYDIQIDQLEESEITDELSDALLQEIRSKVLAAACDFCQVSVHNRTFLIITTTTTRQCTVYKLLKLQQFFSRMAAMYFTLNNTNHTVYMKQSFKNLLDDGEPETFRILYRNIFCPDKIHLNPKFYCERIFYSIQELMAGGVPNNTINELVKLSAAIDSDGQTKYAVCMKDYGLFRNMANSSFAWLWALISTGIVLVFIFY